MNNMQIVDKIRKKLSARFHLYFLIVFCLFLVISLNSQATEVQRTISQTHTLPNTGFTVTASISGSSQNSDSLELRPNVLYTKSLISHQDVIPIFIEEDVVQSDDPTGLKRRISVTRSKPYTIGEKTSNVVGDASSSFTLHYCGDGIVMDSEECDAGANNDVLCNPVDDGQSCTYCTASCTQSVITKGQCGQASSEFAGIYSAIIPSQFEKYMTPVCTHGNSVALSADNQLLALNPVEFPQPSQTIEWRCLGNAGLASLSNLCYATRSPLPIGQCGSAHEVQFAHDAQGFASYSLCTVGSPTQTAFPSAGQRVEWVCQTAGINSPTCWSSRDATPVQPICGIEYNSKIAFDTDPHSLQLCAQGQLDADFQWSRGEKEWACFANGYSVDCQAYWEFSGKCGFAARTYLASDTAYFGELCDEGTPSIERSDFVGVGQTKNWICDTPDHDVPCSATREAFAPLCGSAAKAYEYAQNSFEGLFCETGSFPVKANGDRTFSLPSFPLVSKPTTYYCYNPTTSKQSVQCTATKRTNPCGTAAKNYLPTQSFDSETFCQAGYTSSPLSPQFPSQGSSTSWNCVKDSVIAATCQASVLCGNSIKEAQEECDVGPQNGVSGSGCSNICAVVDTNCYLPDNTVLASGQTTARYELSVMQSEQNCPATCTNAQNKRNLLCTNGILSETSGQSLNTLANYLHKSCSYKPLVQLSVNPLSIVRRFNQVPPPTYSLNYNVLDCDSDSDSIIFEDDYQSSRQLELQQNQAGSISLVADRAETKIFTARVTDENANSASAFASITITQSQRPTCSIPSQTIVTENTQASIPITATPFMGLGIVTVVVNQMPSGAVYDSNTKRILWTPSYTQSGEYTITITCTDRGTSVEASGKVTVIDVNRIPTIQPIADIQVKPNQNSFVLATVQANDQDGDQLSYFVSSDATYLDCHMQSAVLASGQSQSNEIICDSKSWAKEQNVQVKVTDTRGSPIQYATQTFKVTISCSEQEQHTWYYDFSTNSWKYGCLSNTNFILVPDETAGKYCQASCGQSQEYYQKYDCFYSDSITSAWFKPADNALCTTLGLIGQPTGNVCSDYSQCCGNGKVDRVPIIVDKCVSDVVLSGGIEAHCAELNAEECNLQPHCHYVAPYEYFPDCSDFDSNLQFGQECKDAGCTWELYNKADPADGYCTTHRPDGKATKSYSAGDYCQTITANVCANKKEDECLALDHCSYPQAQVNEFCDGQNCNAWCTECNAGYTQTEEGTCRKIVTCSDFSELGLNCGYDETGTDCGGCGANEYCSELNVCVDKGCQIVSGFVGDKGQVPSEKFSFLPTISAIASQNGGYCGGGGSNFLARDTENDKFITANKLCQLAGYNAVAFVTPNSYDNMNDETVWGYDISTNSWKRYCDRNSWFSELGCWQYCPNPPKPYFASLSSSSGNSFRFKRINQI